MSVFLPFVPNWRNGVRDTYEFKTDVFTSRDGSEQRRALRINPRRSIDAAVLLDGDRLRNFADAVNRAKDGKVEVADFSADPALLTDTVPDGAALLTIDRKPAWLANGMVCALMTGRRTRKVQVDFVEGNQVVLLSPVSGAVGHGAQLLPLVNASLQQSNSLSLETTSMATSSIKLNVEPRTVVRTPDQLPFDESSNGDSVQSFGPAAMLFGRYVLLRKPNYLQRPQMQFNIPYEPVDYGRGIVKIFTPVPIVSRTLTASYMAVSRAEAMALLDVFVRSRGRAGEIYVPTWGSDLPPVVSAMGFNLIVEGSDFAEIYHNDRAHAAILIRKKDGTLHPREIGTIDVAGTNSSIGLQSAIDMAPSDIEQVSWMYVSRFAQDALTIEWVTTEVANISLSFVTLANLAVESSFGSNWILATGFWRDRGQWVDSAVWED